MNCNPIIMASPPFWALVNTNIVHIVKLFNASCGSLAPRLTNCAHMFLINKIKKLKITAFGLHTQHGSVLGMTTLWMQIP